MFITSLKFPRASSDIAEIMILTVSDEALCFNVERRLLLSSLKNYVEDDQNDCRKLFNIYTEQEF